MLSVPVRTYLLRVCKIDSVRVGNILPFWHRSKVARTFHSNMAAHDAPVHIEAIPTWAESGTSFQPKQPSHPVHAIDPELNTKLSLYHGDITLLAVDAIVNAANSRLVGGGGVDGAIHARAGPALTDECRELGGCRAGQAKITGGYLLPARHVIHTVGPRGEKPDVLEDAYRNSFKIALDNGLRTIAFPCISTGIYGYPQAAAAEVAVKVYRSVLEEHREAFDRVIICCFLESDVGIYQRLLPAYFPLPAS